MLWKMLAELSWCLELAERKSAVQMQSSETQFNSWFSELAIESTDYWAKGGQVIRRNECPTVLTVDSKGTLGVHGHYFNGNDRNTLSKPVVQLHYLLHSNKWVSTTKFSSSIRSTRIKESWTTKRFELTKMMCISNDKPVVILRKSTIERCTFIAILKYGEFRYFMFKIISTKNNIIFYEKRK